MVTAADSNKIFVQCIDHYHRVDRVDQPFENPYDSSEFDHLLYHKCWIDTVQWHYEDLIRVPDIDPKDGMKLKRLIDASNQKRTDMVEKMDDWFIQVFKEVKPDLKATVNSESPAWIIDRLSILALKIYHMQEQASRPDVEATHLANAKVKLAVLIEQQIDLSTSFDELLADIHAGRRKMKVYRQMKLYNDPATNPALYSQEK